MLLSNANSGGSRRSLDRVGAAAREMGIPHLVTHDSAEIEPVLRAAARSGIDVLAINGGDGTLQATLSVLRNRRIFEREPKIALLRSGTTNMVHRDVGVSGPPHRALRRLAAAVRRDVPRHSIVSRPVIAVQRQDSRGIACGFFFGAAAIPRAIRQTRERFHPRGLTGPAGESLALASLLLRLLSARVAGDPVLHPETVTYSLDARNWHEQRIVLLMVSTLDRLILGLRPMAAQRGLGFLALSWPYRRLWQSLPALLAGRRSATFSESLVLANAQEIAIRAEGSYVLDGEHLSPAPGSFVTLRVAAPARFLKL